MRISCVFFDYDGVLTADRTGSMTTCRFIRQRTGIDLDLVSSAFAKHNEALTLGLTSHVEVWPHICEDLNEDLPLSLLEEAFDSTPVNAQMFELAAQLRHECRVGIITDNKADRMRRLRTVQKLDALFDPIVVSADVGKSKSSPALFEHALSRIGLLAKQSVFIDNNSDNVAVAASTGMNAVYFDDALNDVSGLADRLYRDYGFHLR
ncbi:HAD-IA family hydrolase [Acidovorax sp.]|uniref:HAD-IA family hydrolase n=1 Tax=Acidovorax sp. TaxID=1872122 RepID=UPI002623E921|nr:HAD-IA family hydrolase [Acidovorax sp.]